MATFKVFEELAAEYEADGHYLWAALCVQLASLQFDPSELRQILADAEALATYDT